MAINTQIQNNLTPEEKELFDILRKVTEQKAPSITLRVAGGWTRDKLLGVPSDDIDIMVDNMPGEDFAHLVTEYLGAKDPNIIRENPDASKHIQTAKAYIPLPSGKIQEVDFARARSEIYKDNSRIPDIKPATPEEDAYRRDLTINSLFYNLNENKLEDFTGKGIKDLVTNTIRTPADPLKTFSDDPLRIFRVIRFSAKYNGNIDPETYQAMMNPSLRNEIKEKISKERIGQEITKMLKNPNPQYAITLLKDTGLWQDIVDEALRGTKYEGKMAQLDMGQNNPWHKLTLWGHTMQVLGQIVDKYADAEPEKKITMILASIMHDLGKLFFEIQGESQSHPGRTSYHGHEKESAEIAEHILRYLKMETYIQQVSGLARYHMRPHKYVEQMQDRLLRRFIRQMGEASLNWLDILNVAIADAQAKDIEIDPTVTAQYQDLENKLQEAMTSLGPLKSNVVPPILNGNEVMGILRIKPGKWMSEIMEFVKELKDENPNITKEEASQALQEKYTPLITNEMKKQASPKKGKDKKKTVCPTHLFDAKKNGIRDAIKKGNNYEALSIMQQLEGEYSDDKIYRLIAVNILKLLIIDEKYRDADLLQNIFNKAEKDIFDITLCSLTTGILLLIETATDEDAIVEMGTRMINMSPETMKTILTMLPEKVYNQKLKKTMEKLLK